MRVITLVSGVASLCFLVAAPTEASHPRPKGATPLRVPLVPAYAQCTASNRTHGPPLAFPSCDPPAQTSAQATVGTPDAFGGAANATGFLRLYGLPCESNCFDGDFGIDLALTDVRCVPAGARCGTANAPGPGDYSGEMRFSFTIRLTDHNNAVAPGGGTDTATVQDFDIGLPVSCLQSGSTATGSTCGMNTSINANIPGASKRAKREVWALDSVRVFDGGADGHGDTTADNTVFARPGVFIP